MTTRLRPILALCTALALPSFLFAEKEPKPSVSPTSTSVSSLAGGEKGSDLWQCCQQGCTDVCFPYYGAVLQCQEYPPGCYVVCSCAMGVPIDPIDP